MSMSLSSISNNYVQNLPAQIPSKMVQGFVVTTAVSLVIAGTSGPVALLGGAIAAAATLIEALARPIIFKEVSTYSLVPVFAPITTAYLLSAVTPLMGLSYTSHLVSLFAWYSQAPFLSYFWTPLNVAVPLTTSFFAYLLLNEKDFTRNNAIAVVF